MFPNIFRPTLAAVAIAGLASCATNYTDTYQERLVRALPYPFGVTFSDTQTYPGRVLCGSYTSSDDGGLRTSTGPFVVTPDRVLRRPTDVEIVVHCSPEPDVELFAQTGIGGPDADWTKIAKVRDDMHLIHEAITRFRNSQHSPPRALEDLVEKGFIGDDSLLRDPWNTPYAYRPLLSGGTTARYDLTSLGRDGTPGGTGPDADIDRSMLGLVEHVLRVEGY